MSQMRLFEVPSSLDPWSEFSQMKQTIEEASVKQAAYFFPR